MSHYTFKPSSSESAEEYLFKGGNGIYKGSVLIAEFPPIPSPDFRESRLVREWANYIVTPLIPGSVVSIYWHEYEPEDPESPRNGFHMASTNGWDIGHMNFCSDKTHWEIFDEVCATVGFDWRAVLDKSKTYSFIYHHPEIHFIGNNKYIYLLHTNDTTNDLYGYGVLPVESIGEEKYAVLKKRCQDAIHTFRDSTDATVFGYIFHHKTKNQTFILHSSLWKALLKCVFRKIYQPQEKTPLERRRYIAIRTYMILYHRMMVIRGLLTPLAPDIAVIRQKIDVLVETIVAEYRFPPQDASSTPPIVRHFIDRITDDICPDNDKLAEVARSTVLTPKNLNYVFDHWEEICAL